MENYKLNIPHPLTTDKLLEIQNEEINMKIKADELVENKNLDQAISIYEELVYKYIDDKSYNNGLLIIDDCMFRAVANPISLVDLYFKSKMMDKCWKLLNIMLIKNPSDRLKVREYQSKISSSKGRDNDALMFTIMSIVDKYFNNSEMLDENKIEKLLSSKIKKANLMNKKDEIISLIIENIKNKNYEKKINEYMKKII